MMQGSHWSAWIFVIKRVDHWVKLCRVGKSIVFEVWQLSAPPPPYLGTPSLTFHSPLSRDQIEDTGGV